jgi:hypothetical protein
VRLQLHVTTSCLIFCFQCFDSSVYGIWYRGLLFEVSMENLDGRLMRDRLAANSSVRPHRHREGCKYQKDALFFGLDKNSGTSPSPRWANEPPHSKLCRYC